MFFYKENLMEAFVRVTDEILTSDSVDYDYQISAITGAKLMLDEVIRIKEEKDGDLLGQSS